MQNHNRFTERTEKCIRFVLGSLVLVSLGLSACSVFEQTASGTYQVATAPFRLFQHSTPTPTPVPPPPTPTPARKGARQSSPHPKSSPNSPTKSPPQKEARPSPSPAKKSSPPANGGNSDAASPLQKPAQEPAVFPTARPVPDKPGFVFSPSQPTKYVDVSGYAPGSKVKDPYSGQIFVVP